MRPTDARYPRPRRLPGDPAAAPGATRTAPEAPPLDLGVVEWLERTFPEPTELTPPADYALAIGRRAVVRFVRNEYNRQQDKE